MRDIRFDDRVVIVTGAGGGLGRAHALAFAARGAHVVVNDVGGGVDGAGGDGAAARAVAGEIEGLGGSAWVNTASVTDEGAMARMAQETLARWGRIDVLVANAGILRDKSFANMALADFEAVLNVHVLGAVTPIKAVWAAMRAAGYGRIVVTTSASGLYGNFGQANYAAAKLALVGLMQALKLEGEKHDIRINAISPVAATRMTDTLLSPEALSQLSPDLVSPGVLYLASEAAPSGVVLAAGAGVFAAVRIEESEGLFLGGSGLTPEAVRDAWSEITAPTGQHAHASAPAQAQKIFRKRSGG